MKELSVKDRLALALDVPAAKAKPIIEELGGKVGWIKTNSIVIEAFAQLVHGGENLWEVVIQSKAKVFLDLKFHDIPNTVVNFIKAVKALGGVGMFNLHASGGPEMLKQAVEIIKNIYKDDPDSRPLIIAVTILTSIDQSVYDAVGYRGVVKEGALRLAKLAKEAGCDGVVSSALEAPAIKAECGKEFLSVTPGMRFLEEIDIDKRDQKRLSTPRPAIASGSDILVMGSSLLKGGIAAVEKAYAEIEAGLKDRQATGIAQ